ncbi:unnamed protein product [Notodromas monacha]|uniref:Clusterin-associated protein 1 n=1 Tax=Notodromas monacha TaxID=399045 RepID=A0A7R9BU27_9CRUS|nr:unnamed protein product [Notodromas monacha]CAG0920706.1 unnamed protein product [Notodromas monacha]
MSYRDLRAFCEMMRGLGFPRLVSVENFRNPNFPLVAELMAWLVKRYDPDVDVPLDVDTEQDRVIFVRSVAQLVAEKAHVKINTKRLYEADGHAVKEMLKVAKLLYGAVKDSDGEPMGTESGGGGGTSGTEGGAREVPVMFDAQAKISQLKRTRQLATEITVSGAKLYDLLGKEMHLRQARNTALGRQLELADVENNLRRAVSQVEQEIRSTSDGVDNIAQEEAAWDSKIDKKRIELDRVEKRLQTLRKVRPAFMDEYEKLEGEFKLAAEGDVVTSAIAGSTVVMPATSVPPSRGNDGLESSVPVQIDDDDDDDF